MKTSPFLLLLAAALAETLTVGPFRLLYDNEGPGALECRGKTVARSAFLTQFKPDYKGALLSVRGVSPVVTGGNTLTWKKQVPGSGEIALTVTVTETGVTWRAAATMESAGPLEFGVVLDPAAGQGADGHLSLMEVGKPSPTPLAPKADLVLPADTRLGVDLFVRGEGPGLRLQDWRGKPTPALRLVQSAAGKGGETFRSSIILSLVAPAVPSKGAPGTRVKSRPVPVVNGDFENGNEGWDALPPNGAVVTEGVFAGAQSARLAVADPMTEAVYVTRKVPVTGGARYRFSCMVKTLGVAATPGKKSPIGAGLIVEWGDRNGTWYSAGRVSCGLFGDNPWREQTCEGLRAPEEAGYAMVFLAVRGSGTAWFDDLKAEIEERPIELKEPADGVTVDGNRPRFEWREDVEATAYRLELSPTADFKGALETFEAVRSPFRPQAPLAKGTWYWRLSATGFDTTAPRLFRQTADTGRDTTPPRVGRTLFRVTDPAGIVEIPVLEGDRGLQGSARGDGKDLAVTLGAVSGSGSGLVLKPAGTWKPGVNEVDLTVSDRAGNREASRITVLFAAEPENPVAIDGKGRYTVSGKPVFPLGLYQVSPPAMAKVKAGGFDLVHMYQWESDPDDKAARAYLDAAWANGLRVWIGFDRGKRSGQGMVQGNRDHLVRRIAALSDHPALFCWYLFDEPELDDQYLSPRALADYAALVRSLDPYHPVVVSTWGPRMNQYRAAWDTHWTQAYEKPQGVLKELDLHRRLTEGKSPLTLLLHVYDKEQSPGFKASGRFDADKFLPDGPWLRAAVHIGLARNINGLFWWMYNDGGKSYLTIANAPGAWSALTNLTAGLKRHAALFLDGVPWQPVQVSGQHPDLLFAAKVTGGTRTVIGVNLGESSLRTAIPWEGKGPVEVVDEGRRLDGGDAMEDSFGRFGVHLYQSRR